MDSTYKLSWSGQTDVGRFRKNNEDAFLALTINANEVQYLGKIGEASVSEEDFIFAVSDGMGGAKSGEFASRIAIQKIAELLPKEYRRMGVQSVDVYQRILEELVMRIHLEMQMMGRHYEECEGMGATLSLGWFTLGRMYFAHLGDSRIYYIANSREFRQLTHDDTYPGWLFREGKINEREAKNHPKKNILNKVLGSQAQGLVPQFGWVDFEQGDYFVFCTDGVTDGMWDRRIESMIREPGPLFQDLIPAARYVKEAKEASGRDNITAVVVGIM